MTSFLEAGGRFLLFLALSILFARPFISIHVILFLAAPSALTCFAYSDRLGSAFKIQSDPLDALGKIERPKKVNCQATRFDYPGFLITYLI